MFYTQLLLTNVVHCPLPTYPFHTLELPFRNRAVACRPIDVFPATNLIVGVRQATQSLKQAESPLLWTGNRKTMMHHIDCAHYINDLKYISQGNV